jgi:3-hydroxyacyl-CoA dehydrogenase
MAIHGAALGGGLELAMAGHYRIAHSGTRLGLPEVSLGLLPGAGGTQRLPRLIGAAPAIAMMLSGKPVDARRALDLGLLDEVTEGDVVEAALVRAAAGVSIRRTGDLPPPPALDEAVAKARDALTPAVARLRPSSSIAFPSLPAVLKPASRWRPALFARLMASPASRGLRHVFFGERIVARVPGLGADVRPRSLESVGVIGGGTMGTGIAIALGAGLSVTMVELRPEALDGARATIEKTILRDAEKGRIDREAANLRIARFHPAADLSALSSADLVIEAVFEQMDVKAHVLQQLDAVVRPDTILASNTSTLDLGILADAVADPSRVVGLHFFSLPTSCACSKWSGGTHRARHPRHRARPRPAHGQGQRDLRSLRWLHRQPRVRGIPAAGLVHARRGRSPAQIDGALERWGMAMGPCRTMDLVGQDIGQAIRQRRAVEQPDRPYSAVIDKVCELGRFGQKSGAGLYAYADGRTAEPDPAIEQLILDHSAQLARAPPDLGRGDRIPLSPRHDQRGRADRRRGHCLPPGRRRHDLPARLRLPARSRRPDVPGRPARPAWRPRAIAGAGRGS